VSNDTGQRRRTALITGASSGIGFEFTKLFARDGFDLVLVARDQSRLAKIAYEWSRSFDVTVTVIPKDLSQSTAAQEVYREVQNEGIEVDVLVNNAGFNVYGPFAASDSQRELEMAQVNMIVLTQLTKLFLPAMLQRNSGKILNVASTAAFTPGPYSAVYCASKAYVLSFSEALAEELRGTGISVTTLCPGPTRTQFAERADMTETKIFQGRLASAREVAEAGYNALMQERTTLVVGLTNKLLVFSLRFSPRTLVARVAKNLLSRAQNPQASIRPAH
jgi:short-subunit dehydrogenase